MRKELLFLDLFAGGGGLSEGFIRAGYTPVAHVEKDAAACFTLKTRMAYHWLKERQGLEKYISYMAGKCNRESFYNSVPKSVIDSIINNEISEATLEYIFGCIDELLAGRRLNLIIGGPPCQAYSLVGRAVQKDRMVGDPRNYLYKYYAAFLERYRPDYFVFENVTGLLSAKDFSGDKYFDSMRNLFKKIGYETEYQVISVDNYGVPQKRKRVILVGSRIENSGFFPSVTESPGERTVEDILRDLPALKAGEGYYSDPFLKVGDYPLTYHIARPHTEQDLEIYSIAVNKWTQNGSRLNYNDLPDYLKTHKNRDAFIDRFKVVAGNLKASQTILAHIAKDGHYYIHYDEKQNRSLTPREAARLQTFPDDYYFENTKGTPGRTAAFQQIGNAVPVLLAEKIASKLLEAWK